MGVQIRPIFFTRFNKENIMRLNTDRNLLLSTVGFERLFDSLNNLSSGGFEHKNPSYPPYNIFKESESTYLIDIAVAGFKQNEIDITSEDKKLIIEGKTSDKKSEEYTEKEYASRISEKRFYSRVCSCRDGGCRKSQYFGRHTYC